MNMEQKRDSEEQIDGIVISQANDDTAWEDPILVRRATPTTMSLPPDLAKQAIFFAQIHKMPDVEAWLRSIIEERINFESAAFARLKQSLATENVDCPNPLYMERERAI